MTTTTFFRGSEITFIATCTDKNGNPVTPPSANLYLSFPGGIATVAMTVAANVVSAVWDSSVATSRGWLRWSIRTTGIDAVAQDGETFLNANDANLEI